MSLLLHNIAKNLHNQERQERKEENQKKYIPRWKEINDENFIKSLDLKNLPHNVRYSEKYGYQIDIANSSYEELSADWKKENIEAAKVVANILIEADSKPIEDQMTIDEVGHIIHEKWLERNDWAKGTELDVPYEKLPGSEQIKILTQYHVALTAFIDQKERQQQLRLTSENLTTDEKASAEIVANQIASSLHEKWRESRDPDGDGIFEPRWKKIKDENFIKMLDKNNLPKNIRFSEENGFEIDIANSSYKQLSSDWKKENYEAGKVVAYMLEVDDNLPSHCKISRLEAGDFIHDKWLERNDWAKGTELDVPFTELSQEEQDKDTNQYDIGVVEYNKYKDDIANEL